MVLRVMPGNSLPVERLGVGVGSTDTTERIGKTRSDEPGLMGESGSRGLADFPSPLGGFAERAKDGGWDFESDGRDSSEWGVIEEPESSIWSGAIVEEVRSDPLGFSKLSIRKRPDGAQAPISTYPDTERREPVEDD